MIRKSNIGHWIGFLVVLFGLLALWGLYRLTSDFWVSLWNSLGGFDGLF